MASEFELIARHFTPAAPGPEAGVPLGVGDDCALLAPRPGRQLAVSVDTSVAGVHFPADAPAEAIGYRALAVSLSDLAAMGAEPRWCLMALALENDDEAWLAEFARGFHSLCQASHVALVGGDVTRGELAVGVTVMGEVPNGEALSRGGARAGDVLAVTGALGGGAGGLALWQRGERDLGHPLLARYLKPTPRLAAGQALRGLARAAIDISDGLLADLEHLLAASGVGAGLEPEALPLADGLVEALGEAAASRAALCGGDDYELLVSLPRSALEEARRRLAAQGLALTAIGTVRGEAGISGVALEGSHGWQHFRGGGS
ncbi:thiamine-phosphate kinase [Halomonas sp. MCCC 1A17488]|uniref:Thiamine-monophosphate kinase n=1 Tax=Billgrantia sulfidoxydans TaxID=2733484 RepID=A0ABX7W760_9GAMM|nr:MULTISPECIES: thiamine-phosphate kinase [Halomonas]MCE8018129.1 thiamine-phosphate kinase [Halomonas sp. MCCC 1A17488]MCG3241462.1 thiamine-phosphate kinase [Halomonas sp. MCCC 1A17488]QPP48579.1 thiamine-phosphate kinase [Halomonas sp. SS10-MC5]QTP55925.1 thiamine-phosphate kinase [Halomonas sulfidoxydans]